MQIVKEMQKIKKQRKAQLKQLEKEVQHEKQLFQDDLPAGDQPFESEPDVKMACVKQMVSKSFCDADKAVQNALQVLAPRREKQKK